MSICAFPVASLIAVIGIGYGLPAFSQPVSEEEANKLRRPPFNQQVALGVVETDVRRTRALNGGDRIVAGWSTRIGTSDDRGFEVSGSLTFTFKDGKIASLKVVTSPKPDGSQNLRLDALAVDDIGRLALAAWCVV
jgi:hypothetical protein